MLTENKKHPILSKGEKMVNLDKVLEQEKRRIEYRDEYNRRSDVKARRKIYNEIRNFNMKIAGRVLKGELSREDGLKRMREVPTARAARNGAVTIVQPATRELQSAKK